METRKGAEEKGGDLKRTGDTGRGVSLNRERKTEQKVGRIHPYTGAAKIKPHHKYQCTVRMK